jgi:hypothetical protein
MPTVQAETGPPPFSPISIKVQRNRQSEPPATNTARFLAAQNVLLACHPVTFLDTMKIRWNFPRRRHF